MAKRDIDGSDAGFVGVNTTPYTLEVADARLLTGSARKTCETNGFELLSASLSNKALDFHDHQQVARNYYPECEELVAASTGAKTVLAFDHNIRSAQGKNSKQRIIGGQQVQGPAKMVHGDYTLVSAPQRLQDLALVPKVNDTLYSVLEEGTALLSQEMVERCLAKHKTEHQFYSFPQLTRDEPLLLKQWDSKGALAQTDGAQADASEPTGPYTFSFHSAFDDPATPDDAPDRWSIEVRCIVLYN